jgi:hypothetical protein
MTDNLYNLAPRDEKRINVEENQDLEYWTRKFGVTSRKLRAVVREVGEMAQMVDMYLAKTNRLTVGSRS